MATSSAITVVVTLLVMVVSISTAQAQTQTCASKLVPCAQYLNSTTTPPNSCCDPIKEAVANDLECLCGLYENPSFLTNLGIDVQQALRLPRLCGISSDTTACKTAQAPGGSSTQPPPGSTPGGNGAGKIASSGVVGLLFISTFMMLF
ncbi:putative plant non-specific lipid-transfer protein/Par allergen [Helianthus debilis subsp. tardiflorus]